MTVVLLIEEPRGNWTQEEWESQQGSSQFESRLAVSQSIVKGYLYGQLANVGKAALWWSSFGILAVSILGSSIALAATRGAFNLALLLSSPLAVAATEVSRLDFRIIALYLPCVSAMRICNTSLPHM